MFLFFAIFPLTLFDGIILLVHTTGGRWYPLISHFTLHVCLLGYTIPSLQRFFPLRGSEAVRTPREPSYAVICLTTAHTPLINDDHRSETDCSPLYPSRK